MKTLFALASSILLSNYATAQIYDTNNPVVQSFAGSGFTGYVDGQGQQTMFNYPIAISRDASSNLAVLDSNNFKIRSITQSGLVSTFVDFSANAYASGNSISIDRIGTAWIPAGGKFLLVYTNGAQYLQAISGMGTAASSCFDSRGALYIADPGNNKILIYTNFASQAVVFAGSGNKGAIDGNGIFTSFNYPTSLACDTADNIYVWDSGNYLIRKITPGRDVVTMAGHGSPNQNIDGMGTNSAFTSVSQMCFDRFGNLLMACGNSVRRMDASSNVTTVAGNFSQSGYVNGAGNIAKFNSANGICILGDSLFIADSSNQRIRQITFSPTNQIVPPSSLLLSNYPGLQITGTVGRTYQIQTSPDMAAWTNAATLMLNESPHLWIDQTPIAGNKFYRAVMLP